MKELQATRLLEEIKRHNSQTAFRELYDLYYNRLFRIAFYYLHTDEWAQEVVLDVFLNLWNNRSKLLIPDNFDKYSFVLIKNASFNYLRKEQKHETSPIDSISEVSSDESSPEQEMLDEELFLVYLKALDELPERCREVFLLLREEKMSYAQVAEQLNISTKTVDAQLQKAMSRLKEKTNQYFQESP